MILILGEKKKIIIDNNKHPIDAEKIIWDIMKHFMLTNQTTHRGNEKYPLKITTETDMRRGNPISFCSFNLQFKILYKLQTQMASLNGFYQTFKEKVAAPPRK